MERAFIISNNPKVWQAYPGSQKIEGSLRQVLVHARNLIHLGCSVINHPLAGSVQLNETPFKSLILTAKSKTVDDRSVRLMESAMEVLNHSPALERKWSERVIRDFQRMDLSLLQSAVDSLPAGFILEGGSLPLPEREEERNL
ncbi:GrdX family protein [Candidatus Formimonas warabiya]|uniref:GrdX protein n=1 Tax=Formimonas warabiya TaxID=1761012 RepID=A0A3G1KX64_FORW1|nr:GrdX family protein [Candidatus Formimonas warabiya]ATW27031.1 hypothetical protein DCMF_21720 [Candidatus Formimonas warabiya]